MTQESGFVRIPDRDRNEDGAPENARPRDRFGAPLPRGSEDAMADRIDPEGVYDTLEELLPRAAELFSKQRFFEAHEFYEWAWKGPMTQDEDRDFFKGMAQICVGYCHTQRGNAAGALALLQRGADRVESYGERHMGVDVTAAASAARSFREALLAGTEPGPEMTFPAFPGVEGRADE